MKQKSFWVALATVAMMSACSQEDEVLNVVQAQQAADDDAIEFSVYTNGKTRATSFDKTTVLNRGFWLSAFSYNPAEETYTKFLFSDHFTYTPSTGENGEVIEGWKGDENSVYTWTEGRMQFFAFVKANGVSRYEGTDHRSVMYESPSDIEKMEDVLYAYAETTKGNTVEIQFKHALAWLEFEFITTNETDPTYTYKLTNLTLDARSKAKILLKDKSAIQYLPKDPDKNNIVFINEEVTDLPLRKQWSLLKSDESISDIMVIPGPPVHLNYTYTIFHNDVEIGHETGIIYPAGNPDETTSETTYFYGGMKYKYTLHPTVKNPGDAEPIGFTVTVDQWNTPEGTENVDRNI